MMYHNQKLWCDAVNLQQMRCLCELTRHEWRVSATARALNKSQPAITKQLRQLENELGAPMFLRAQHRIAGLTPMGEQVVRLAQEVCLGIESIRRLGKERTDAYRGEIRIATTHAQAKFVLPELMQRFSQRNKHVKFELKHALPAQIVAAVASGEADIGVTPEIDLGAKDLRFVTYRSYPRMVLFPRKHALLRKKKLTLSMLASYPIITTSAGFAGRTEVFKVFAENNIQPNVQLSAPDFDVVKVCLERGLGIAIMPSFTFDRALDKQIRAFDASHLFPPSVTSIVIRRNRHLPKLVQEFLEMVIPNKWNGRTER